MNKPMKNKTIKLTKMAMLVAISITLASLVHFPIFPSMPFLEYDPADIPIIIGTFAFGPVAGVMITLITSFVQGVTVSSASGVYGILMHSIATGSYVILAGIVYNVNKTRKNAILAMILGTLCMTAVMCMANIWITPLFMGVPQSAIFKLLPTIAAFNIIKAGVNSIITFFLYKKISSFLHKENA